MKTIPHDLYSRISNVIGADKIKPVGDLSSDSLASFAALNYPFLAGARQGDRSNNLLTEEALTEIAQGRIPDLSRLCLDLYNTFLQPADIYSAVQFIPILKQLGAIDPSEARRFIRNPVSKHVLVNNPLLKVVLIHWKPGTFSNVHGHPAGGCVFKVLKGRLREKRYTPDGAQRLISVSTLQSQGIAYIDDDMAYHAVGNPYSTSAVSLHVYTPGGR